MPPRKCGFDAYGYESISGLPPSGETLFRSPIENALDIITVLDANASFLYQSPNIEQLLDTCLKN